MDGGTLGKVVDEGRGTTLTVRASRVGREQLVVEALVAGRSGAEEDVGGNPGDVGVDENLRERSGAGSFIGAESDECSEKTKEER